ncbi:MAG: ABC transporter ATP-binding protein [Alphaproteobacteria bacterium GM7ARS4]|nr:ABC transporter ATP-binding protein [Alphaproteobacteria bacterium GM7ARS4]
MTLNVHIQEKSYIKAEGQQHHVLGTITFSLREKEFMCLSGPSGCGKTTLLNIIAGLEPCPHATIDFATHDTHASQKIAYVFQEPRLMPWLNVMDNVTLVTDNSHATKEEARQLLHAMGLGDVHKEFPNRLSGGMQRRVALARAFITKPQLLLMDEPFVSLDPPLAQSLRTILLSLWTKHPTTILFITHDIKEALFLSDRILFMDGKPTTITLDYRVDKPRPRTSITQRDIDAIQQKRLSTA